MSTNQTEYNILGCTVRVKSDEDNTKATEAISLLQKEIDKVKAVNPTLAYGDLAVLSALNLAGKVLDTEAEYKENIFTLKSGVEDALKFVEKVSPGTMQVAP